MGFFYFFRRSMAVLMLSLMLFGWFLYLFKLLLKIAWILIKYFMVLFDNLRTCRSWNFLKGRFFNIHIFQTWWFFSLRSWFFGLYFQINLSTMWRILLFRIHLPTKFRTLPKFIRPGHLSLFFLLFSC